MFCSIASCGFFSVVCASSVAFSNVHELSTLLSLDRLIATTVSVRIFFCRGTKFQISSRLAVEALNSKIYDFWQLFSSLVCFSVW